MDYYDGALDIIYIKLSPPKGIAETASEEKKKSRPMITRKSRSFAKSILSSILIEEVHQKEMYITTPKETWDALKQ